MMGGILSISSVFRMVIVTFSSFLGYVASYIYIQNYSKRKVVDIFSNLIYKVSGSFINLSPYSQGGNHVALFSTIPIACS